MSEPAEAAAVPDQSIIQPTNAPVFAAVMAKLEEVLESQREGAAEIVKLRQRVNDVLTAHKHLSSEVVELRKRVADLETPPTKLDLLEMLRDRDAKIAQLKQELADRKAVPADRG